MVRLLRSVWMTCGVLTASLAWAQAIPAPDREVREPVAATPAASDDVFPARPWVMPAIQVQGERKPALFEEERIGSYRQPRWTAQRRFPTTRVYVAPAGRMVFEYWNQYNQPLNERGPKDRRVRGIYEFEWGLGHRLQLDLYLVTQQEGYGSNADITLKKEKVELRYALADWGKLPGNPAVYFEWSRARNSADAFEFKLLFGGELAEGWHAAANLSLERKVDDGAEHEYQVTAGLSKTLSDRSLSLGLELRTEFHDVAGARMKSLFDQAYLLGPSICWYPVPPMHVLLASLAGAAKGEFNSGDSTAFGAAFENWLVVGWTF